ncbi:DUF7344 domain-containing protein [Salinigranum marinum]|uniref:DUF7344 domain-containing protein n=1 Tax=Salinigranum marinum TaxID=1515595 RepID=UPI002989BCE3|nr:hypothetical protein [Salinigranum marinum]
MTQDVLTEPLTDADGRPIDGAVVTAVASSNEPAPPVAAGAAAATEIATDTLFELLKNQRRRDALDYLKTNGGRATLSDMAEHIAAKENDLPIEEIAAKENDLPIEEITSKQRKRVYIGLYQCHLPKLATAGVVGFDKNRGTIELRSLAARLYPYLDAEGGGGDATLTATAMADTIPPETTGTAVETTGTVAESSVLAGLGVAALAGVAGVPGFELLSPVVWAVVCALGLLVAAALPHLRD